MVYVYSKKSEIEKYVGKKLKVEEIESTLKELGMDVKGVSKESDPELKIELTAEKVDMISTLGIARSIKYYLGIEKKVPRYEIIKGKNKLIVKKSASKSRPKTVAAIIRNIDITQEKLDQLIEIQEKIHESFGRGRKKGAIGIYPLDEIQFPIAYKSEKPEEIIFRPLESKKEMNALEILELHPTGKKYAHLLNKYDYYPVFRDNKNKVLSMPPIINSYDTGRIQENHKDLFIECSGYNMMLLNTILTIIVTTLIEMGGKAETVRVEYEEDKSVYELNLDNKEDEISVDFVNKLIGLNLNSKDMQKLLPKMMYGIKNADEKKIKLEIPCFRFDVWHDVDIADDIARAYGYNNINLKFPNISSIGKQLDFSVFKEQVSNLLANMGFLELYTYILTSTKYQYESMGIDEKKQDYIKLIDSSDEGINMCRTSLLSETLRSLHVNRRNKYPQKVFENGFAIKVNDKVDTGASNETHLTVSIADPNSNYTEIKAILDSIFNLLNIEFKIKKTNYSFFIKGRSAKILINGEDVGHIGELNPQTLTNFGLIVPVSSFEINLKKIYELIK